MFGPPLKYHQIQQEFLSYTGQYCSVVAGRAAGKTEVCIRKILEQVSIEREYHSVYWYMLPTQKQVSKCLWPYFTNKLYYDEDTGECLENWSMNRSKLQIKSPSDNLLYLVSANVIKNYEGMQLDGVIIDGSSDFPPGLVGKYILPMLSYRRGFLYRTGVPVRGRIGYDEYRNFCLNSKQFCWSSRDLLTKEHVIEMESQLNKKDALEQIDGQFS